MNYATMLHEACAFLGVDRQADADKVRAAWKRKLKEVHPDIGGTTEAAQYATSMRDIVLAWIEAGRPDLECPADAAQRSQQFYAADFTWEEVQEPEARKPEVREPESSFPWTTAYILGLGLMMLMTMLSAINPPPSTIYGLPVCRGMDMFAEMKAMLDGKCWTARRR